MSHSGSAFEGKVDFSSRSCWGSWPSKRERAESSDSMTCVSPKMVDDMESWDHQCFKGKSAGQEGFPQYWQAMVAAGWTC